MRHAKGCYRRPDGAPTTEVKNFKLAIRQLKTLYGRTTASQFGPLKLKTVRQQMIDAGLSRGTINKDINRIRHIFKWGAENELIPASVLHGLQAVSGLRYGRTEARETERVKPVPEPYIDAVLPHVSAIVGAMIELQRITGMRSGEVTIMRGCDLNMMERVWIYAPSTHKTAHRGHERKLYLGPKAQKIIKPFLTADLQAFLFSPASSEAERNGRRFGAISANRKTRVYPCELRRREKQYAARQRKPKRRLRDRYDTISYYRAVTYGIQKANKARLEAAAPSGQSGPSPPLAPPPAAPQRRHALAAGIWHRSGPDHFGAQVPSDYRSLR